MARFNETCKDLLPRPAAPGTYAWRVPGYRAKRSLQINQNIVDLDIVSFSANQPPQVGTTVEPAIRGVIWVYDVTVAPTLTKLEPWLALIKSQTSGPFTGILIGNQCDYSWDMTADVRSLGRRKAQSWGIMHAETSAETGYGVIEALQAIARAILEKM